VREAFCIHRTETELAAKITEDRVFRVKLETVSSDAEIPFCFAFRTRCEGGDTAGVGQETLNPARMQQEVEA
jgi:hypothetical protein